LTSSNSASTTSSAAASPVSPAVTRRLGTAGTRLGGLSLRGVHLLRDRAGGLGQLGGRGVDGLLVIALDRFLGLLDGRLDRRFLVVRGVLSGLFDRLRLQRESSRRRCCAP
jgi:hypothetical protein